MPFNSHSTLNSPRLKSFRLNATASVRKIISLFCIYDSHRTDEINYAYPLKIIILAVSRREPRESSSKIVETRSSVITPIRFYTAYLTFNTAP